MRRLILGTAGHIDHGKTALVRALTGIDTDRLPEEKRRGITIDIGFAHLALADGCEIDIIDVPGHEAFIRNMLAGATGIDLVLLVVAADEGVMPQTREHLAITELLGVSRGVVAVTKCDLVDEDWLQLVREDIAGLLAPTPLADAPVIPVSARTGAGLDRLVQAIAGIAESAPVRDSDDLFRMPIDRVFSIRGTGTVVTGTVWSGRLRRDEHVRVEPAGVSARVRALQHHGTDTDTIGPGSRAAIALVGLDRQALTRGDTVVSGEGWSPASILTARVAMLRDAPSPLRPRQRVRVHVGTAEVIARVAMLEGELAPGATEFIQLRLEAPLLARAGDHIVLRSYSPVHTIGGGLVLEPMAPKRKRLTNELRYVLSTVHDSTEAHFSAVALADRPPSNAVLPVLTGLSPALVGRAVAQDVRLLQFDDRVFDAKQVTHCTDIMTAVVRTFHAQHPLEDGIDREALRRATGGSTDIFEVALQRAIDGGQLQNRGAAIAQPDFRAAPSATDLALIERLRSVFETAALQAPSTAELAADMVTPRLLSQLRHLEREGSLVRVSNDRWLAAGALHRAVALLRAHLPVGQQVDIADFRNILGLSRKHLIPLLEFLDRSGVTVRRGDGRVLTPVDELAFVSSQETAAPLVPEP